MPEPAPILRILCLEDNPLIAFHIEQMIEDLGHVPALTLPSFEALSALSALDFDLALVDIDLADGCTGPRAADWLGEKGVPSIFVTGQRELAENNAHLVNGYMLKPVDHAILKQKLDDFASSIESSRVTSR